MIGGPAHLVGFSDGGEVALLMAIQDPPIARSVAAWGAAGSLPAEAAGMAAAMGEIVDHPMPGMEGFRDYFVGAYGEENARLTTRSCVRGHGWDHRPRWLARPRSRRRDHVPGVADHRRA